MILKKCHIASTIFTNYQIISVSHVMGSFLEDASWHLVKNSIRRILGVRFVKRNLMGLKVGTKEKVEKRIVLHAM
jgi:hypothetical protein